MFSIKVISVSSIEYFQTREQQEIFCVEKGPTLKT